MSNIRIIYDNLADVATITTSAVSLPSSNLITDIKSAVCRSTSKTLTITLNWPNLTSIDCLALAFTNLSSTATMNVKGYVNTADTTPLYDATKLCAEGSLVVNKGVNNFAYGGGIYASHWLPTKILVRKIQITISDASNAQDYVEVGRLIAGSAWVPVMGVEQDNTNISVVDTSVQFRTEAGNMHVTVKPRHRKQNLSMPSLGNGDKNQMWRILWNNGTSKPIFLSLYPNDSDKEKEQSHMLYGRLVTSPSMGTPYFSHQNAVLDIEEI